MNKTSFAGKCSIMGEFWQLYKEENEYSEFIAENDLGFPLAFAMSHGIISQSTEATKYIEETWGLLLGLLDLEDYGFSEIEQLLD